LFFPRITVTRDHRLDLARGVTEGRDAGLCGSEKNYPANFGETQSCFYIECCEYGFERNRPRLELLNQVSDLTMDAAQMSIRSDRWPV
jgi:hypothetical protein